MSNQIVISSGAKVRNLSGVLTGTAGVVNSLGINVPSGIPQLDGSGKILVSQLPNSVMEYKGTWNAATNTPTLVNGTGNQGDVYLCNVAGTVNFGAGPITFSVGDQVIYSGTIWQRASGATGTVTSVAVTESGDALTITGSPITTSGTINIGFAGTSGQYVNGAGGLTTFPSLTGFVPYTGATGNVNLGEFGLTSGFVGFDLSPTGTPTGVGTLSWDSAYRTLQLIDGDGDTTLQIGQEQRALIHNNTGATLTDGQVVYVTGSTGNLPTVALASNTLEASSSVTFGVVTETIANGADGFVTISGTVNGLDTLAFNEGDALYLGSTAGTFTNVKPVAPANLVLIGYMIKKAGGNGSIFVKIQNGYELEELHDVLITSVANNEGIFWDSATSLWKNNTIAGVLGYTPANAATYVPYSGATQNVNLGVYNIELGAVLTNKTANGGLLMKQNTTISAEVSGTNYTSIKPFDTRYLYFDFGQPSSYKSFRIDANGLTNATLRTYTIPDASGTIALTSDIPSLSAYVPYTGATTFVDLGTNSLTARGIISTTGLLVSQSGGISASSGSTAINGLTNGLAITPVAGTIFSLIFPTSGTRSYTYPDASGTIALTSNLSSYVPYTGATSDVNLGMFSITTTSTSNAQIFNANGSAGSAGQISMKWGTGFSAATGYSTLGGFNNGFLLISNIAGNQKFGIFDLSTLTTSVQRTYTLPDASGTLALTSQTGSLTAGSYFLTGMTAGSGALYYNAGANRVTLANYNASGILTFEVNGGATALTLASTGAATFSSSVNIGTNTASGSVWFLSNTTNTRQIMGGYSTGAGYNYIQVYDGSSFQPLMLNNSVYINGSGNVGIGTTNPTGAAGLALVLNSGASQGRICIKTSATGDASGAGLQIGMSGADAFIEQRENAALSFATNAAERMRITSGGEVLINQTSVEAQLTVNALTRNISGIRIKSDSGTAAISVSGTGKLVIDYPGVGGGRFEINDAGTAFLRQYSNGTLSISSGQVVSSSDINLKNDDGGIENALSKVLKLNPRYFYWKEDSGIETTERQLGFYAQEVQESLGIEVANKNSNEKWGIYDRGIIAMLTKAIQEQQAQIEELKQLILNK